MVGIPLFGNESRKNSKAKSAEKAEVEPAPNRREFLMGAGSLLLNAGLLAYFAEIAKMGLKNIDAMKYRELFKDSPVFSAQVLEFMKKNQKENKYGESRESVALANGKKIVIERSLIPRFRSRIEFLHDQIMKRVEGADIPDEIREELSFLAVGIAGQESLFKNDAKSGAGAHNALQVTKDTAEHHGHGPKDMNFFDTQVTVARELLRDTYLMLEQKAGPELATVIEKYFAGRSDEDFNRQFLVPVILNGYNAGPARMVEIVQWFAAQPVPNPLPKGYDVFAHMAEVAVEQDKKQGFLSGKDKSGKPIYRQGYRTDASEYVPKVYAFAFEIHAREN